MAPDKIYKVFTTKSNKNAWNPDIDRIFSYSK